MQSRKCWSLRLLRPKPGSADIVCGCWRVASQAWVQEAWAKCVEKDAGAKYVSVWTDAGYRHRRRRVLLARASVNLSGNHQTTNCVTRCYTATACDPNGASSTRSWESVQVRRRRFVARFRVFCAVGATGPQGNSSCFKPSWPPKRATILRFAPHDHPLLGFSHFFLTLDFVSP